MRKKEYDVLLLLLLTVLGGFCACRREQETGITVTPVPGLTAPPENTKAPSVTEEPGKHPTAVPTREPSPTPVPEGELIPIDEVHFTSGVFRSYLADYYDMNQDGYLSYPERAEFRYFSIGYYEHEFEQECLDGFEYFPDLKELDISCAEKVVLRNCPSLVKISGFRKCRREVLTAPGGEAFLLRQRIRRQAIRRWYSRYMRRRSRKRVISLSDRQKFMRSRY